MPFFTGLFGNPGLLLGALGASIPISTALDNVLIALAAIAWVLAGAWGETKKLFKIKYL